jgi:hypothetical protein
MRVTITTLSNTANTDSADRMKRQAGNTLFVAVLVMATLAICVAVAIDLSVGIGRNAQRSRAWSDGTAIGLGSLDLAFSSWRQICRGSFTQALPTSSFSNIPAPTTSNFPAIPTFTIANYSVQAVDPQLNALADANTAPPTAVGQNTSTSSTYYLASADVTIPVIPGNVTVKVRRVLEKQNVSPWNWAIFYNDPLEIHPGPPFTVTGWVHTNSMLYTGHNTLTFASKVTYTGGWKVGFMPGDATHPETPTSPYWPTDLPPAPDQSHQPFGIDPNQTFSTTDTNPNNDGWHELIDRAVLPLSTYPDPLAGSRYYDQAGIKVLIDSGNNVTVLKQDGTSAGNTLTDTIEGAITTGQTIQDNREGGTVRLVTLDVSALYNGGDYGPNSDNSKGLKGFNGIIYILDTSATSSARRAIRLKNGSKLAAGGLTIASGNPIYVQGNYNTGAGTPPSNTGDPTNPTVAGYTRQPAAIIADAVDILSNAWSDGNSTKSLANRVASNTTVNAAILAGIVPTGTVGSNYSGGVENFPRFLEDWTGKSFTYYGSMVELYPSQQATGIWGSNNVYVPPNRNWYFDTNFYSNPPKGSLVLTNYVKQKWFLQ